MIAVKGNRQLVSKIIFSNNHEIIFSKMQVAVSIITKAIGINNIPESIINKAFQR